MRLAHRLVPASIACLGLLAGSAQAQDIPIIPGVTGTFITKTTHIEEYAGAKLVVDKVGEGIGAVFHPSPDNDLPGLREGSEVTVQYLNVPGAQIDPNRQTVGGMVTRINGDRDRINICSD
jgi:hypothetical protein